MPEQVLKKAQSERLPTIDGKEFDRVIIVPVIKSDGYEKMTEFQAKFYHHENDVSEIKNISKPELARMGIDPNAIEKQKTLSPLQLNSSRIESPLYHAERILKEFKESTLNKEFSADEFKAMKAERARLESNVIQARKTIDADNLPKNIEQSASKGFSM